MFRGLIIQTIKSIGSIQNVEIFKMVPKMATIV